MASNNRPTSRRRAEALSIAACMVCILASAPGQALAAEVAPGGATDPFEGLNRGIFSVNQFLDRIILRPAAMAYVHVVPSPIRKGLKNIVTNLGEPSVFVNDVFQGHGKSAVKTAARFVSNSTFGIAGLFDIATPAGLPHHDNDFGITLARYGLQAGPYLMAPVGGPTTLRDALGAAADLGLNPLVYVRYRGDAVVGAAMVVTGGLQARADADQDLTALYEAATDPYASLRSYFLQHRQAEVTGGKLDLQSLPEIGDEPPAAAPPETAAPQAGAPEGATPETAPPEPQPPQIDPPDPAPQPPAPAAPEPSQP
jgi:phospholipid-binding lipoprotein MlaA